MTQGAAADGPLVELRAASLAYGLGEGATLALADATISIRKGEFIAVDRKSTRLNSSHT